MTNTETTTTTALITVTTDYPWSLEHPGLFLGSRQLGELRTRPDGTSTLYTPSHMAMGACTHAELVDTDLMAALIHLQPEADRILQDDLDWEASRKTFRADRLARGLTAY